MRRLALALAGLLIGALMAACDADGLCPPAACDADIPCLGGLICSHGVCLVPCDEAGACSDIDGARCLTDEDGHSYCGDADGLPIQSCKVDR